MALAAESIRQLTRACIGARVYQGLLFCFVLLHNVRPVLSDIGYSNRRLHMWLTLGAIVLVATLGTYCQWRFGRVEPQKDALARQILRATLIAALLVGTFIAIDLVDRVAEARPIDLVWLVLSAGTALALSNSRGDRLGWVLSLLASAGLLATLVVPMPCSRTASSAMAPCRPR